MEITVDALVPNGVSNGPQDRARDMGKVVSEQMRRHFSASLGMSFASFQELIKEGLSSRMQASAGDFVLVNHDLLWIHKAVASVGQAHRHVVWNCLFGIVQDAAAGTRWVHVIECVYRIPASRKRRRSARGV